MIQVFGSSVGQEEIDGAADSISKSWMGMGPKVAEFEKRFSERLGQPFLMTNNGSNALHLAIRALALKPCKIIVPSFTWAACANAVMLEGHTPVFADSELDGNVSFRSIKDVYDKDVGAIMVVHYGGKPVPLEDIMHLGVPVIEDAAHAVDSKIGDKFCGSIADVGVFSFDPIKNLATPDAGGLTVRSQEVMDKLRTLRLCGVKLTGYVKALAGGDWWKEDVEGVFPKYIPNDVTAAIGLAQFEKLPRLQERRRQIWEMYQKAMREHVWIVTPPEPALGERHSYFTYLIRVINGTRDGLARYLKRHDVYTTLRFWPLHYASAYPKTRHEMPNCEMLAYQGLNLPLHPSMTDDDVGKVIDLINRFL
jgi:aminotransferase